MTSQWYIQPAIFAGVTQLIPASLIPAPPSAPMAYTLVPYVGALSAAAPWPCLQINPVSGPAAATAGAAHATPPVMSGALALPPAPDPAPAPAAGMAIRIVLHGRARLGLWTRIADAPYHAGDDLPDPASLRAAAAAATRVHYPPDGRLLGHAGADAVPPPTLRLWAMRAGAQLRMLEGEAGGGALCTEDVERTVAVRAEAPGADDEADAAEAEAVRGLLEHARDGRLGVFLLVNMDGDDSLGVPGHGGRSIGAP